MTICLLSGVQHCTDHLTKLTARRLITPTHPVQRFWDLEHYQKPGEQQVLDDQCTDIEERFAKINNITSEEASILAKRDRKTDVGTTKATQEDLTINILDQKRKDLLRKKDKLTEQKKIVNLVNWAS